MALTEEQAEIVGTSLSQGSVNRRAQARSLQGAVWAYTAEIRMSYGRGRRWSHLDTAADPSTEVVSAAESVVCHQRLCG